LQAFDWSKPLAVAEEHLLALASADGAALVLLVVATGAEAAMLAVTFMPEPPG
jgi:nucleotide-binding universal stress UspA family protein